MERRERKANRREVMQGRSPSARVEHLYGKQILVKYMEVAERQEKERERRDSSGYQKII